MKKLINKSNSILTIELILFAILLTSSNIFALDTTECFDVGIVTDLEGYYNFSRNKDEQSHSTQIVVGGGPHERLSYTLSTDFSRSEPDEGEATTSVGAIGAGLTWTVIKTNPIEIDLLPHFTYDSRNNFKAWTLGGDMEINFILFKSVQPFIVAGFANSYDDANKWSVPVSAGFMIPAGDRYELFAQYSLTPEQGGKFSTLEKQAAIGFNASVTDSLEIISEAGYEFSASDLSLGFGLIYSL
ncbi:MAG: hypothetical protein GY754_43340 [bacterium]|nr:hypothetical protein [bacterium]